MPINGDLLRALTQQPGATDQPVDWWRTMPPAQRGWWPRVLNTMPYANGQFRDEIFREPPALGTETLKFDRNAIDPELRPGLRGPRQ